MASKYQERQNQLLLEQGKVKLDTEELGLPDAILAERLVIGAIFMNSPRYMPLVAASLLPEHFFVDKNRLIYQRALEMYAKGDKIDRVTVAMRLRDKGELESVGGLTYMSSLDANMPELPSISEYIKGIQNKAMLRRIIEAAQGAMNQAFIGSYSPEEIIETLDSKLREEYVELSARDGAEDIADILEESGGLDGFLRTQIDGCVEGPWPKLGKVTGWFRPGQMIVVAARPGCGKTIVGLQLAAWVSRRYGPAAFHTLEVDKGQLVRRLISALTKIEYDRIDTGLACLTQEEIQKIGAAANELAKLPLRLVEDKAKTVLQLRSWALRQKEKPKAIFVDYIGLMRGSAGRKRNEEIGEISRGLKELARELGIPIFIMVQLNRDVEKTDGGIPELWHLRESGDIEQDADKVMMLHRPALYMKEPSPEDWERFDIYVRKNRQGKTGCVQLRWCGSCCYIANAREVVASMPDQVGPVIAPPQFVDDDDPLGSVPEVPVNIQRAPRQEEFELEGVAA